MNPKAKIGPTWNVRLLKMTKKCLMAIVEEVAVEADVTKATIVARAVPNTSE